MKDRNNALNQIRVKLSSKSCLGLHPLEFCIPILPELSNIEIILPSGERKNWTVYKKNHR